MTCFQLALSPMIPMARLRSSTRSKTDRISAFLNVIGLEPTPCARDLPLWEKAADDIRDRRRMAG